MKKNNLNHLLFYTFLLIIIGGCARVQIKDPAKAMRPTSNVPTIADDLGYETLLLSLKDHLKFFEEKPNELNRIMNFGPQKIMRRDYYKGIQVLVKALEEDPSGAKFEKIIREKYQFMEIYGQKKWAEVFMTSYFDPVIPGSKKKTKKFSQALYKTPNSLVSINFDQYMETFPKLASLRKSVFEQKSRKAVLRGRIIKKEGQPDLVVPFYSRKEIDSEEQLKGQKLEIVWVDPIDAFFLQIQGSGLVRLEDGSEIKVGYASQNGHSYYPIGRELKDVIPIEKMSLQTIEAHLRTLSLEDQQKILNTNASYVFFQKLDTESITFMGTPVRAGRTIATDYGFFPKGALSFLKFKKPRYDGEELIPEEQWQEVSRFVMDQDTGGAIRGPGRLDLYWGKGEEAKKAAGVMRHFGQLYYLFPDPEWIKTLDEDLAQQSLK